MAELGDGVSLIRAQSEGWVRDDEVGGLMQLLFEDGENSAGLWKPGDQGVVEDNVLPARETVVVVHGSVRIEIEGAPTLDLVAGDLASLPEGAITTWHPSPDFVKVWVSG